MVHVPGSRGNEDKISPAHLNRAVRQRVCELFAGVGGFRHGLGDSGWQVVWSNQWEPGRSRQDASDCYVSHFGRAGHLCQDIASVEAHAIPNHDLLVGGFPCQDYSVATANAQGIAGKKGVLWWEIRRVLEAKRPMSLLLENVDRLLKSPTKQRGRDFGVMLWCLDNLGYAVEWRTLNAADYGAPQKRRRVFIFGTRIDGPLGQALVGGVEPADWVHRAGFFAKPFPIEPGRQSVLRPEPPHAVLPANVKDTSDHFRYSFGPAGLMREGKIWTYAAKAVPDLPVPLASVLQDSVDEKYFIPATDLPKWRYLKGAKAEKRVAATGFEYHYSEGPLPFPDPLDRPGRTMLTDEGGLSPSRFKHIIRDPRSERYRVLTPIEAERMNQFPDDWTATGMPERARYFCMGNALVVGLVRRMGYRLQEMSSVAVPAPWPSVPRAKRVRARRD
jgi:DNA (cytosine-5)-methyltransferase 1